MRMPLREGITLPIRQTHLAIGLEQGQANPDFKASDLAAAGLALIMAVAVSLHVRRKEYSAIALTGLLFLMAAFVAYGRWSLVP